MFVRSLICHLLKGVNSKIFNDPIPKINNTFAWLHINPHLNHDHQTSGTESHQIVVTPSLKGRQVSQISHVMRVCEETVAQVLIELRVNVVKVGIVKITNLVMYKMIFFFQTISQISNVFISH